MDASGKKTGLAVDGGVKKDNIRQIAQAGARFFVAGSSIFPQSDYKKAITEIREELK